MLLLLHIHFNYLYYTSYVTYLFLESCICVSLVFPCLCYSGFPEEYLSFLGSKALYLLMQFFNVRFLSVLNTLKWGYCLRCTYKIVCFLKGQRIFSFIQIYYFLVTLFPSIGPKGGNLSLNKSWMINVVDWRILAFPCEEMVNYNSQSLSSCRTTQDEAISWKNTLRKLVT